MNQHENLIEAVHEHWILSGVALDEADDMAEELADHLSAAVADGKDIDAVVGPNLRHFADDWAEPATTPDPLRAKAARISLGMAVCVICWTGAQTLFGWSTQVMLRPIETGVVAILAALAAYVIVSPATSRLRPNGNIRSRLGVAAVTGLVVGLILGSWIWLASTFEEAWTVQIPSWLAVSSVFLTVAIMLGPPLALAVRPSRVR